MLDRWSEKADIDKARSVWYEYGELRLPQTEDSRMITDFTDFCTWIYVLVSDLYAPLAPHFARPGPAPVCSDAELLTISLVRECCGWDQETDVIAWWQHHRDLVPHLPSRTRFHRRRRHLQDALALVRRAILAVLAVAQDAQCISDSLPLPVVQLYHASQASTEWAVHGATFGKCASKKQTILGFKLHLLLTFGGVIRDVALAPAHAADGISAAELLEAHQDLTVLGDKGYISEALATALRIERHIRLLTLPRANQTVQPPVEMRHRHNHLRQLVETVNSQLDQQFAIETNHAHSFWGLTARLLTKLTAHTLWLNRLLGNIDFLCIERLAFPIYHMSL